MVNAQSIDIPGAAGDLSYQSVTPSPPMSYHRHDGVFIGDLQPKYNPGLDTPDGIILEHLGPHYQIYNHSGTDHHRGGDEEIGGGPSCADGSWTRFVDESILCQSHHEEHPTDYNSQTRSLRVFERY